MKISIITAVWNGAKTIRDAMESVGRQRLEMVEREGKDLPCRSVEHVELEYIVVDGGSTDGTVECIREFEKSHSSTPDFTFRWISEKDNGLYDAINKGIRMATGDVVGICNADDVLDGDRVVVRIAREFEPFRSVEGGRGSCNHGLTRICTDCEAVGRERDSPCRSVGSVEGSGKEWPCRSVGSVEGSGKEWPCRSVGSVEGSGKEWPWRSVEGGEGVDCVYGKVRFVKELGGRTVRRCFAKLWRPWMLQWGYMPPHPGVFIRCACFEKWGGYVGDRKEYKIAADYELLIRYFRVHKMRARYSGICTHVMRTGGVSTRDVNARKTLNAEIIKGNRVNGYFCCWPMLLPKYAIKIWEVILPRIGFAG